MRQIRRAAYSMAVSYTHLDVYKRQSLVIRAIRDYFSPEIGEILIDTDEIADQATAFMSVVLSLIHI